MYGVKEQVRNYILDNFLIGLKVNDIQEDTSFLDIGIIDSTGVIELISFLEETYGIRVEDKEMVPENLDSLKNVERYVAQKMALPLVSSA